MPFIIAFLQLLWVHFYAYKGDVIGHYADTADSFKRTAYDEMPRQIKKQPCHKHANTNAGAFILNGQYSVFANLCWHEHAIPLSCWILFQGNRSDLLKSNFVRRSPKSRRLMKGECAASNEHVPAGSYTSDSQLSGAKTQSVYFKRVHTTT